MPRFHQAHLSIGQEVRYKGLDKSLVEITDFCRQIDHLQCVPKNAKFSPYIDIEQNKRMTWYSAVQAPEHFKVPILLYNYLFYYVFVFKHGL